MTNKALEKAVEHEKKKQALEDLEKFDQSRYTDDRDLANRLLGRVQATNAISVLADCWTLMELKKVKENKLYRSLKGSSIELPNGETADVGTWVGFCKSIGLSKSKVDEDLLNLEQFGELALSAMNNAGLGYRDMRKLRQLPNTDRSIIVNEVEANLDDKESIVNLIDDLSAKHVTEKESLNKEITDLKQKDETNERLFADKDKKINELDRKLDQANNTLKKWTERTYKISLDTTNAANDVLQAFGQLDTLRDTILNEPFDEGEKNDAIEAMAIVYYDAVRQVFEKSSWLMQNCNDVFEGYKSGATPLIDLNHLYDDSVQADQQ